MSDTLNKLQKTQLSPSRVSRQRLVESSKMGPSSNIWYRHYQIEIAQIKKLSACQIMGLPAAFRPRSFRLQIAVKNTKTKNIKNHNFCLLLCMGVKLGQSHWGTNIRLGCSRIRCWGRYVGPKGKKWQENGQNCTGGDFHNLYLSLNIVWVIKWWKIRWAGHVARVSEKTNAQRVLMETPEETDCSEDLCVERILLKWLQNKQ